MTKGRLEAVSDGVIAIIITIMVLELKAPHGTSPADLKPVLPSLLSYLLSFTMLGTYWNNHHHLLQAAQRVSGTVLWANLHLLFWLSLVPFMTDWMGETFPAPWPVALYGVVLLLAGVAYYLLAHALLAHHGKDSALAHSLGDDRKGKVSVVAYALAVPLSFANAWFGCGLYALVAIMWIIPDRRIERTLRG